MEKLLEEVIKSRIEKTFDCTTFFLEGEIANGTYSFTANTVRHCDFHEMHGYVGCVGEIKISMIDGKMLDMFIEL